MSEINLFTGKEISKTTLDTLAAKKTRKARINTVSFGVKSASTQGLQLYIGKTPVKKTRG